MTATAGRLFKEAFDSELIETAEEHPNTNEWSAAGRGRTKTRPNGEDATWWRAEGPGMVQAWIDWRQRSLWQVWTAPDGTPGIELGIEVEIDGFPLKMFIDRVMVEPVTKALVIVDLKTGARTPESDLQLGFYRLGILEKYGVDIRFGGYWMARKGTIEQTFDLTRFKPALMRLWIQRWRTAIEQGIFLPHITSKCRACSVRDSCAAFGGHKSETDPDSRGLAS